MAKIEPFELFDEKYDDWFEENQYVYQSELEAVGHFIPPNGNCIEIGVGSGRFASPLKIHFGIEPSQNMRERARERGIMTIGGVAEKLPFYNMQFDYALMVTTICFLDNISDSMKEIYRILKLGGKLVIGFVDKESLVGKKYMMHKSKNVFYKHANFYSVHEVITFLKQQNFNRLKFKQTIFHDLAMINKVESVIDGYGKGSFVVICAEKQ